MQVIVGLGNPEERFVGTRHNVGFFVLDELAKKLGATFENKPNLFSEVAKTDDLLLVKPQTYMNDSGRAVTAVLNFYKLTPADLVVVHDDLDLELGSWKQQFGTGPKEHNGLLSIYEQLGTEEFMHVRIGVDGRNGDRSMPGKDYVLQRFSLDELTKLIYEIANEVIPKLLA